MELKIRSYIERLFAAAPPTLEVYDAREELVVNAQERYQDLLARGFDQQAAYDLVIDSIGDIRELMEELSTPTDRLGSQSDPQENPQGASHNNAQSESPPFQRTEDPWRDIGDNLTDLFKNIGSVISSATTEAFQTENWILDFQEGFAGKRELVNRIVVPLEGCHGVNVDYTAAQVELCHSHDGTLIIEEYMNRNDSSTFCTATQQGGTVYVKSGRRQSQLLLHVRVKIYIPADFHGDVTVASQSGSVKSSETWMLRQMTVRSISGGIKLEQVDASMISIRTTSGTIRVEELNGTVKLHSVSGALRCGQISGSGEFKTTSGGIQLGFEEICGSVTATSVSGGIRVGVPDDVGLQVELTTMSGGIHTVFDRHLNFQRRRKATGLVGSAPFHPLTVRTTSGGIHIND